MIQNRKAILLPILLLIIGFITIQIYQITAHEETHQAIANNYAHTGTIHYGIKSYFQYDENQTISEQEKILHSNNEIISYNIITTNATILLATSTIILTLFVTRKGE